MKIVVQRCSKAMVIVNENITGQINQGLVLLVCIEKEDRPDTLALAAKKILDLRCFEDPQNGKMNLSIAQVNGAVLAISQFTLSWDGKKGNRPSFDKSAEPVMAKDFFAKFVSHLREHCQVEEGVFGANMQVTLTNQGPVTFTLSF